MPKLISSPPKYRHHRASGQAVVTFDGRDYYLGPWQSKASRIEYDRLIGEWLQNGRTFPPGSGVSDITVVELINAYRKFANRYYVKDGQRTREAGLITETLTRFVQPLYGRTQAAEFGPLALKAVRNLMIDAGHSRGHINKNVDRIRRMFRWAASEELISPVVVQALATVPGLRKGRTEARETSPVCPVDDATVDATLVHLPDIVTEMVRFQRLTGCRPAEVCIVRPCDIDRSSDVWIYRPESHKTEHQGRERMICVGPKAQDVLRPYLLREKTSYCFQPAESEKKRRETLHQRRQTPMSCGNRPGTNRKRKPKRRPGVRYDTNSYRRAIHRAVDLANRDRDEDNLLSKWGPNRLRHAAGTEIRRLFGLEAAQTVLGHSQADVTQVYAQRDIELAKRVIREVG